MKKYWILQLLDLTPRRSWRCLLHYQASKVDKKVNVQVLYNYCQKCGFGLNALDSKQTSDYIQFVLWVDNYNIYITKKVALIIHSNALS